MIFPALDPYAQTIKTIVAVALLAAVFYGGWKLKDYQVAAKENKELKAAIKEKQELQNKYDELSGKVLEAVGRNDQIQQKIIERTYKEIEKPIYKECVIPSSGIIIENEQIQQLNKQIVGDKARVE